MIVNIVFTINRTIIIMSIQERLDKSTIFRMINKSKKIENILLSVFIFDSGMI